jgi:hypothetical protein
MKSVEENTKSLYKNVKMGIVKESWVTGSDHGTDIGTLAPSSLFLSFLVAMIQTTLSHYILWP